MIRTRRYLPPSMMFEYPVYGRLRHSSLEPALIYLLKLGYDKDSAFFSSLYKGTEKCLLFFSAEVLMQSSLLRTVVGNPCPIFEKPKVDLPDAPDIHTQNVSNLGCWIIKPYPQPYRLRALIFVLAFYLFKSVFDFLLLLIRKLPFRIPN